MGRGNGAYKISSIYCDHEIDYRDAEIGDMVIVRENGQWDRIKYIKFDIYNSPSEVSFLTKHGKEYRVEEVMVVRY